MKKIISVLAVSAMVFMFSTSVSAQELRSSSGSSTGKIESDGTIRNGSGSSVGKIDNDGTIRNESGSSIGKIDDDGTVRNDSGSSIGSASGVPKAWAAVVFFFFRFN
ncbi:MAG TPA: hypothetical protein VK806_11090 [Bacteroidia bacterium]|nr:hypothetical protein [Bacteroidia bacterium]